MLEGPDQSADTLRKVTASFMQLFAGYAKAHGRTALTGERDGRGKAKYKSWTERKGLTEQDWYNHLLGQGDGIGVIPLCEDNTVHWCVIDVDEYKDLDHGALALTINELGLRLIVAKSKSGGAHLFQFFSEPVPAAEAQEFMQRVAAAMGFGGAEIFPKQNYRTGENDIGNWLNMPYYGGNSTERYAVNCEGEKLNVVLFAHTAKACKWSLAQIKEWAPPVKKDTEFDPIFLDGPPCLEAHHRNGGFPEGMRNDGMYEVVVFLKKAYADTWQQELPHYNELMCGDKPRGIRELNDLVKSHLKKEYVHRCNKDHIKRFCNRKECVKRKFGIGQSTQTAGIEISNITRYVGEPTLWMVEVSGVRIQVDTPTLKNYNAFATAMMETHGRLPPSVPQPRWEQQLITALEGADVIEIPGDANKSGMLFTLFDQFAHGPAQAVTKEEIVLGVPYNDKQGRLWFKFTDFTKYLATQSFRSESSHHVFQLLRNKRDAKEHKLKIKTANTESGYTTIDIISCAIGEALKPTDLPAPQYDKEY